MKNPKLLIKNILYSSKTYENYFVRSVNKIEVVQKYCL